MGRIGITVCKCAGWGDLGYINRWTMEMTNHMDELSVVLVVGMRVAQLIFYQVDPLNETETYAQEAGKYQTTDDVKEMIRKWTPDDMIPKLWLDKDIHHFHEFVELPDISENVPN
jgi:dCTP deaminase